MLQVWSNTKTNNVPVHQNHTCLCSEFYVEMTTRRDCLLILCYHHARRTLNNLTGKTNNLKALARVICNYHAAWVDVSIHTGCCHQLFHTFTRMQLKRGTCEFMTESRLSITKSTTNEISSALKAFPVMKLQNDWSEGMFCEIKMSFIKCEFSSTARKQT